MINFNELPCDVLDLIFKHNRSWTSKEISKNKSVFNEMVNELNGLNRRKRLRERRRRGKPLPVCSRCGDTFSAAQGRWPIVTKQVRSQVHAGAYGTVLFHPACVGEKLENEAGSSSSDEELVMV